MRFALVLLVVVAVTACAPRGRLAFIPPEQAGTVQRIYFATNRGHENGVFDGTRAGSMSYGTLDVSVPKEHEPGQVETPGRRVDPATDFTVTGQRDLPSAHDFRADLNRTLAARPRSERNVTLFIHGYNVTFAEGLFRLAQIGHDIGDTSVPVLFSWPSGAEVRDYLYDRDSAMISRKALGELVDTIIASNVERLTIVSHSMGAQLAMETLRSRVLERGKSWPKVSGFVLIQPDIDIDLFRAQAADIGPLPQPFVVFTSRRDRILSLSARLNASTVRLGALENLAELKDLRVTVIDTTDAADPRGANHFTAVTSPAMIRLLRGLDHLPDQGTSRVVNPPVLPFRIVTEKRALGLIVGLE